MSGSFVSPALRARVRGLATPIAVALGDLGLTPNALTIIGFVGTCIAAYLAATQAWLLAGVLVIAFGAFDLLDGALARATGRVSRFGAFLDSTLDRTGENLVYVGIAVGVVTVRSGFDADNWILVGLAASAMAFASVVTYARAKAEVIGLAGEVGFAPREVRLAILGLGLVITDVTGGIGSGFPFPTSGQHWLTLALGIITILSVITVLQRIVHVRRQLGNEQ
jgi:CDP-diacylglycerol--glycerol-3-phosphate 3-phosphatidyltransferase